VYLDLLARRIGMTTVRRRHAGDLVDPVAIAARLREEGHTVGKTRAAILEAVRGKQRAFTAEELAESLDDVHVSTVYRTLGLLEEIGVVRHIHLSHGPAIYERTAVSSDIRHLVCESCGRHVAVPRRVFDTARRTLERDYDFVLDGSHFAIVGRCRSCAEAP
jgi:Fur family ferric uptake transcriptional regulator